MSVAYSFFSEKGVPSPIFVSGCFGGLFSSQTLFKDQTHLVYYTNSNPNSIVTDKSYRKTLNKRLGYYRNLCKQFPWISEVVTVTWAHEGIKYIPKDTNFNIRNLGVVAKFDLSKPADTVWFCLNLIRFLLDPRRFTVLGKFDELVESIGLWDSILVYGGFNLSKDILNNTQGVSHIYSSTCIWSPSYFKQKEIDLFKEDPIQLLNKSPSVSSTNGKAGLFTWNHRVTSDNYKNALQYTFNLGRNPREVRNRGLDTLKSVFTKEELNVIGNVLGFEIKG